MTTPPYLGYSCDDHSYRGDDPCPACIEAEFPDMPAPVDVATERARDTREAMVTLEIVRDFLRTKYEPSCQGHVPSEYGLYLYERMRNAVVVLGKILGEDTP